MKSNQELFVMQDTMFSLQMATFWIQDAAELAAKSQETGKEIYQDGDPLYPDETPTLKTPEEQLNFLYVECANLSKDIYVFINDVPLGQLPQMWLLNAITRLTEAKFSVQITAIQYGKLQSTGGDRNFSD